LGGGENIPHAKEEVSCPMSHNRAKAAVRKAKGKGKANSSSQSEHDSAIGDMLSTLRKMSTIFLKVQLWKQWNTINERSTTNMNEAELKKHHLTLKIIEKELNFMTKEEKDRDEEANE
jgi:hypothetical protein